MIGVVFAALVLTTIYAYMQTPMYTADATILLKPGTPQIMGSKDASQDQDMMYDTDVYENFQKTQYEILRSRTLAAYVIRAENLEHNGAFMGPKPQPRVIASALSSVSLWLNHTNGRKARPQAADQRGAQRSSSGAYRCLPGRSADRANHRYRFGDNRIRFDRSESCSQTGQRARARIHQAGNRASQPVQ